MAKNWVDFKKIKADVSMKMVLEGLKESGASLSAFRGNKIYIMFPFGPPRGIGSRKNI
jgi:hypothetical protein